MVLSVLMFADMAAAGRRNKSLKKIVKSLLNNFSKKSGPTPAVFSVFRPKPQYLHKYDRHQ